MKQKLLLSQCMIVKNEEDNIRQALSWGKNLVTEQIVVDTGSTDRTVEIAESMGAKVFHFEWIDDFSAAKNFALEKASGDWIAFLDADEYIRESDMEKLRKLLLKIAGLPSLQQPDMVRCSLVNVDEKGEVFASSMQDRFFRNTSDICYQNKIHEKLYRPSGKKLVMVDASDDISIIHTGYTKEAFIRKNKGERNITLLKKELEENPNNYGIWCYLGDSLVAAGRTSEGKKAYLHVTEHPEAEIPSDLRLNAISSLLRMYINDKNVSLFEAEGLYRQYEKLNTPNPDVEYAMGLYSLQHGLKRAGIKYIEKALQILETNSFSFTLYLTANLESAYNTLVNEYKEQGNTAQVVRYATLSLKYNRYQETILSTLLQLFMDAGESVADIWKFTGRIYDLSLLKDKLFIYKETIKLGFYSMEDYIYSSFTKDEREWLYKDKKPHDRNVVSQLKKTFPDLTIKNMTDVRFAELLQSIREKSPDELTADMKHGLDEIRSRNETFYSSVLSFYQNNGYYGNLSPEENDYSAFSEKADILKNNIKKIENFYSSLEDYRSRQVVYALLQHWIFQETLPLAHVKENTPFVFDTDLFPSGDDCTMLEFWAGEGNDVKNFREAYGDSYRKIICCTKLEEETLLLRSKLRGYDRVQIVCEKDWESDENMKNAEPVHFLCLHGYGEESALLDKCSGLIRDWHPFLMISAFYGHDDLWQLQHKIMQIDPSYQFYLRYYGEDLIATDYFLIAK